MKNLDWFHTLNKPTFAPPDMIFGPVWTALYILMVVSVFLLLKEPTSKSKLIPITLFIAQLILNLLWSPVFFGNMDIKGGLVIVISLLIVLILTIISFYRISNTAGLLLIPYLLWVIFASALNYQYYILN